MTVTLIIYAIGWGPTLAIGYAFVVAGDLEEIGSRVWRPALVWTVMGIALGELAIALGWVHSYVSAPDVHGLAALSALGVGIRRAPARHQDRGPGAERRGAPGERGGAPRERGRTRANCSSTTRNRCGCTTRSGSTSWR